MDRHDSIIAVEFSGKEIAEFQVLDVVLKSGQLLIELFKKKVASLFVEDADRLLKIAESVLDRVKWAQDAFDAGFFLQQRAGLFR
ncbi:MAG: hypothetical protein OHK006_16020 [Thermodesulfovibrionales bacterium]